ncbi:MAG TPA: hypothetical protein PKE26_15795 [Kiritimatiellia bacterium]|nr:hypothetical protein [Kiritimatiellia bacterium]HMP00559.1 hypothetical protein [Kiritimatiellia bacterium]
MKTIILLSLIGTAVLAQSVSHDTMHEVSRIMEKQDDNRWNKETKLITLLANDLPDIDKGAIYLSLTRNIIGPGFDSSIPREPQIEKVLEYANDALLYPQSPLDQCQLYGYLHNALRAKYSTNIIGNREHLVLPLLKALNVISSNLTIAEKQPRITGFVYNGDDDTNSALYQQNMTEMNALIEHQNQIIFQNKLLDYKGKYISWVIALYSQPPDTLSDLDKLANNIIGDPAMINELLDDTRHALERFVPKVQSTTDKPAPRRDVPPSTD